MLLGRNGVSAVGVRAHGEHGRERASLDACGASIRAQGWCGYKAGVKRMRGARKGGALGVFAMAAMAALTPSRW